MRRKALFVPGALAVAIALASCVAHPDRLAERDKYGPAGDRKQPFNWRLATVAPGKANAGKCNSPSNPCLIQVTVTSGPPCKITLEYDYIVFDVKGNRVPLKWKLVNSADWAFDRTNGIAILDPQNQFAVSEINSADPTEWGAVYSGTRNKLYFPYDINVVRGSQTCKLDPGLITDWP